MGGFVQFGKHQNHDPEEEEDTLSSCPFSHKIQRDAYQKHGKKTIVP